jgi:iron complex outermembrane receptor protein
VGRRADLLLGVLGVVASCTWLPTAFAQSEGLEEVVVTGSRIVNPDFESASPVVTIPAARFQVTSSVNVETTLNAMPQFVGSWGSGSNNPGPFGQAQLSLRGLNNTATLILVDGRRLVPSNGNGVPDVNLIPPSLIERVEVLTGGASAVYGSDALAGVVNFHLKDHFEGLEFGGNWGQTDHSDGQTYAANLTGGLRFASGRGALMGSLEYARRDQVNDGDRRFSRVALDYYPEIGQFLPGGSRNILEGRVRIAPSQQAFDALLAQYGYAPGTVPYQPSFGFNSDGTLFTQGSGDAGSVANFRGVQDPLTFNDRSYTYNFAPPNALQLPLDRTTAFLSGRFGFNDAAELYADGLFGDYSVNTQVAPTPVPQVYFPTTNPYISPDLKFLLDSRSDPNARVALAKRTLELGPRISENNYRTYQATLGLRGRALGDWQYDAYAQYGHSDQSRHTTGNVRVSKFEELLYAADGGQAACGGLDPFGLNSISAECARYMAVDLTDQVSVSQFTAEISLSGAPLDLPAGSLHTVFGVFYKDDTYSQQPDPAEGIFLPDGRNDIAGAGGGVTPVDGEDHNVDLFVETLVPILKDEIGARSLQAVLGYRYSDYASAGGTNSYKAELLYQPVDAVRLRGSFEHAVRAPSVFELYDPQLPNFPQINAPDPCSVGSPERSGPNAAAVAALCVKQGLPAELLASYDYQDDTVDGYTGGNPDLTPEKATTYTAGVVLSSPFDQPALRHLQVSLDWYDIHITRAINVLAARQFVAYCYDPAYNPNFDVTNRYCSYFGRDAETGTIVKAYEINRNVAGLETSGVDLQLDWRADAGSGEVSVNWLVGWLGSYDYQAAPEVHGEQWRNTGCCPTLPEWKWNLATQYRIRDLTLGIAWQYFGSVQDYQYRAFDVPSRSYVDLSAVYDFKSGSLDGLSLRAGVTNVLNQEPPIFPTYQQANTDPSVYDVLGRRYFVGLNYAIRPNRN